MGSGTFDSTAYRSFTSSTKDKSTDEIYASRGMNSNLDPKNVNRESRDSADNPNSTPIIVGLDVTGSMGMLADVIAREGLGVLFESILDRKPISDPHLMFMAIGDANYDRAPLQVSQFEADSRIIEQLTQIYIEHGGGGNSFESYNLPWYFGAFHTAHDSIEKRGKRGYLFTVGDEEAPQDLTPDQIETFLGYKPQGSLSNTHILEAAQRVYDVFHIIVEEGSHARRYLNQVVDSWTSVLGQRVIRLADHKALGETIVSAIEVAEGRDAAESVSGWGKHEKVVHEAVRNLPKSKPAGLIEELR